MEYRRKQMKFDKKRMREHLPEDLRDEDIDEKKGRISQMVAVGFSQSFS